MNTLKVLLNLKKLVLHFKHYLFSSLNFTGDEVKGKEQHLFREVNMDFKTRNPSKKKLQA